jgi:hypothetical protein
MGLVVGSYIPFRWVVGGRQLCALLVGVGGRQLCALQVEVGGRLLCAFLVAYYW